MFELFHLSIRQEGNAVLYKMKSLIDPDFVLAGVTNSRKAAIESIENFFKWF